MPRKTLEYTIQKPGRDFGKKFLLTEMPSSQAEKWAMRAFLAMTAGGLDIPEEVAALGIAGIASMGFTAVSKIPWNLAEPLLDEMMMCVQSIQPKGTRRLVEDDIEEVATRLLIRKEMISLHFDFFTGDEGSNSEQPSTHNQNLTGVTMQTSPVRSPQ